MTTRPGTRIQIFSNLEKVVKHPRLANLPRYTWNDGLKKPVTLRSAISRDQLMRGFCWHTSILLRFQWTFYGKLEGAQVSMQFMGQYNKWHQSRYLDYKEETLQRRGQEAKKRNRIGGWDKVAFSCTVSQMCLMTKPFTRLEFSEDRLFKILSWSSCWLTHNSPLKDLRILHVSKSLRQLTIFLGEYQNLRTDSICQTCEVEVFCFKTDDLDGKYGTHNFRLDAKYSHKSRTRPNTIVSCK